MTKAIRGDTSNKNEILMLLRLGQNLELDFNPTSLVKHGLKVSNVPITCSNINGHKVVDHSVVIDENITFRWSGREYRQNSILSSLREVG